MNNVWHMDTQVSLGFGKPCVFAFSGRKALVS